jgi:hypothetical protein
MSSPSAARLDERRIGATSPAQALSGFGRPLLPGEPRPEAGMLVIADRHRWTKRRGARPPTPMTHAGHERSLATVWIGELPMTTLLRLPIAVSLLVMACGPAFSADREFVPSEHEIAALENAIRLPDGSKPLGQYRRFYAGKVEDGKHMIVAIFKLDPSNAAVGIVGLAHLPVVFDGGCSVVDVQYEVESRSFLDVRCGGVA